jgi:hypothetical protein
MLSDLPHSCSKPIHVADAVTREKDYDVLPTTQRQQGTGEKAWG